MFLKVPFNDINFKYRFQEEHQGTTKVMLVPLCYMFSGRGLDLFEKADEYPGRPRRGNVLSIDLRFATFMDKKFKNSKPYAV